MLALTEILEYRVRPPTCVKRRLRGKTVVSGSGSFVARELAFEQRMKPLEITCPTQAPPSCRRRLRVKTKVIIPGRVDGFHSRRRLIGKQKKPQQLTQDRTETDLSKNDGIWPELGKIDELLELDTGGLLAIRLTTRRTTESK